MDDAGASRTVAQVHAGVSDFVLEQLVQLPAQLFHQLGHLDRNKTAQSEADSSARMNNKMSNLRSTQVFANSRLVLDCLRIFTP